MGQSGALDIQSYKRAIRDYLEKGEFNAANEYCHRILDLYPADSETYILKLCAEVGVRGRDRLADSSYRFVGRSTYKTFLRYASDRERGELEEYDLKIQERFAQEQTENSRRKKKKVLIVAILIALCVIAFESTVFLKEFYAVKKVEKLIDAGDYQAAKEAIDDVRFYKAETISDYIDAKTLYEKKEFELARTKFEELNGYRDSEVSKLLCDYYIAVDQGQLEIAGMALDALRTKGPESIDQDELAALLDNKARELEFYSQYNNKCLDECLNILHKWAEENQEGEADFVKRKQRTWYEEAVSLITNTEESVDTRIFDAEKLLNLCSIDYSDVSTYLEIYKAYYDGNIEALFEHVETYPLAESLLFFNDLPSVWLIGRWESKGGEAFFDCSYDGEYFYSTYNLPCEWVESNNTSSYVDYDGTYYIFDKGDGTNPPDSRKAAFKIHIRGEGNIQMLCYKGSVNWGLIKK